MTNKRMTEADALSVQKLTALVEGAEAILKLQARIGRLPKGDFRDILMGKTFEWFQSRVSDMTKTNGHNNENPTGAAKPPTDPSSFYDDRSDNSSEDVPDDDDIPF